METKTVNGLYRFAKVIAERNHWIDETQYSNAIQLPRIICEDGFSMSVQAGSMFYSMPREDLADEYTAFEIGYPSYRDELIDEYCEGDPETVPVDEYFETVYPFVPAEIVQQLIEKHGGLKGLEI